MKPLNVDICLGTTCFVMGAAKLQDLENIIKRKYKELVEVNCKTCLGYCQNNEYNKSPYVQVGEDVISEATVEKVLNSIERQINE